MGNSLAHDTYFPIVKRRITKGINAAVLCAGIAFSDQKTGKRTRSGLLYEQLRRAVLRFRHGIVTARFDQDKNRSRRRKFAHAMGQFMTIPL